MNDYNLTYVDLENHTTRTEYYLGKSFAEIEKQFLDKHKTRISQLVIQKIRLISVADSSM